MGYAFHVLLVAARISGVFAGDGGKVVYFLKFRKLDEMVIEGRATSWLRVSFSLKA